MKHGVSLALFNLYSDEFGNPECPKRLGRDEKAEGKIDTDAAAAPKKSIAVLPFENLSEDKANVYFADGIQEEILTRLSRIADLKVISRTSTQRFKNTAEPMAEIAKQLGVANILEGSVRKAGDKVRVHVQLIDAENDAHLWAERYDRQLDDIFEVESDIAEKIAEALQAKLTGAERRAIAARPTKNTEAHELYLKGRYHWRNFYAPGYERVREYFEQAITLDPSYAPAYTGLSLYYSWAAANAHLSAGRLAARGRICAQISQPRRHACLKLTTRCAAVELYYKRNWAAAERAFHRGMEFRSELSLISTRITVCACRISARFDEAIAQKERAMQLDPFFPGLNVHYGTLLFFAREYDRAAAQLAKTLDLYPDNAAAHQYFGEVLRKEGLLHEAITQWLLGVEPDGASRRRARSRADFRGQRDSMRRCERLAERELEAA